MKKLLLLTILSISNFTYSQTNEELKSEMNKIKSDISTMKSDIQSVKAQNIYLKKSLAINTPILENTVDDSSFKITKVIGNKNEKTVSITFLVETKNENKKMTFGKVYVVDIEGNRYDVDYMKSSNTYPELTLDIPIKLTFTFNDFEKEHLVLKLFKFSTESSLENNLFKKSRSIVEFKDLNIVWE